MKKNLGFTLIELLVVVAIIAVLAVIGTSVFTNVQKNMRDGRRKADLHSIKSALEIYKLQYGYYPRVSGWVFSNSGSSPWITGLDSSYMMQTPLDPVNTASCSGYNSGCFAYSYFTSSGYGGGTDGKFFALFARLENPTAADLNAHCTFPDGTTMGSSGNNLNYGNIFIVCNQL